MRSIFLFSYSIHFLRLFKLTGSNGCYNFTLILGYFVFRRLMERSDIHLKILYCAYMFGIYVCLKGDLAYASLQGAQTIICFQHGLYKTKHDKSSPDHIASQYFCSNHISSWSLPIFYHLFHSIKSAQPVNYL